MITLCCCVYGFLFLSVAGSLHYRCLPRALCSDGLPGLCAGRHVGRCVQLFTDAASIDHAQPALPLRARQVRGEWILAFFVRSMLNSRLLMCTFLFKTILPQCELGEGSSVTHHRDWRFYEFNIFRAEGFPDRRTAGLYDTTMALYAKQIDEENLLS